MKRILSYVIFFAIIGLVVGYLLFGKIAGEYVNIKTIFGSASNPFESFGRNISGLTSMKQNIFISGGIGAVLGFVIVLIRRK
jgi:hypothetical protein